MCICEARAVAGGWVSSRRRWQTAALPSSSVLCGGCHVDRRARQCCAAPRVSWLCSDAVGPGESHWCPTRRGTTWKFRWIGNASAITPIIWAAASRRSTSRPSSRAASGADADTDRFGPVRRGLVGRRRPSYRAGEGEICRRVAGRRPSPRTSWRGFSPVFERKYEERQLQAGQPRGPHSPPTRLRARESLGRTPMTSSRSWQQSSRRAPASTSRCLLVAARLLRAVGRAGCAA